MTPHYNDNGGSDQPARLMLVTWDRGVKLLLSTRQQTVIIYCECGHIYHGRGFTYAVGSSSKSKLNKNFSKLKLQANQDVVVLASVQSKLLSFKNTQKNSSRLNRNILFKFSKLSVSYHKDTHHSSVVVNWWDLGKIKIFYTNMHPWSHGDVPSSSQKTEVTGREPWQISRNKGPVMRWEGEEELSCPPWAAL